MSEVQLRIHSISFKTQALLILRRARGGENLRLPGLLGFVGYG
jgi:hypothetical protein